MIWILFVYYCFVNSADGLDNGLAKTPPMGWMSWGRYRCNTDCVKSPDECISEKLLLDVTNEFISGGYADAGYQYVIVDDCWMQKTRHPDGSLLPDWDRFPNGMKYIADYIHKVGLKFGIYETYGTRTCEGYAGSKGYVEIDAETFASWDVDYLKLDGCYTPPHELDYATLDMFNPVDFINASVSTKVVKNNVCHGKNNNHTDGQYKGYPEFSRQLNKTGRPIVYSCSWPYYNEFLFKIKPDYKILAKYCNLWRNYHDIADSWPSIKNIINYYGMNSELFATYSGPGQWNDPDMLMIGNSGLDAGQSRIQMAVWSVLAAPLIMSNDIKHIAEEMKRILLNVEVIAVNQDPLALQGAIFKNIYGDLKIWRRQLIPVKNNFYSYAFAFVNMNGFVEQSIIVNMKKLELKNPDGYTILDLFAMMSLKNITETDNITITVKPMDVIFYKFQVL